jgi:hypothetical protein
MLSAQAQINPQWPKSQLPSGLGAGGRGKEKAPCRYLHYEIDWDAGDAGAEAKWEERPVKKPHRLALGLGPKGTFELPVSLIRCTYDALSHDTTISCLRNGSIVTCEGLITPSLASSMLSWPIRHGTST